MSADDKISIIHYPACNELKLDSKKVIYAVITGKEDSQISLTVVISFWTNIS